jgi:hypothetical protein
VERAMDSIERRIAVSNTIDDFITSGIVSIYHEKQKKLTAITNKEADPWRSSIYDFILIKDFNRPDYFAKAPLLISVREDYDGEYVVSFQEGEISASGETADEALRWLKEIIVDSFELFSAESAALGPLPTRQLKVLEKYVGKEQNR